MRQKERYRHQNAMGTNIIRIVKIEKETLDDIFIELLNDILFYLENNESHLKDATQELYKEEFYNGTLINSGPEVK